MIKRRRFKQVVFLRTRLLEEARRLTEQAKSLPFGPSRHAALKKARQAEVAAHMDEWLNSPGLAPPNSDPPDPR